jgi:hypothetical protein
MAHRSRLGGLIIDCKTDDLEGAAAFWGAALGMEADAPEPPYVALASPAGWNVAVQQVDHDSRVHLDIGADDVEAEVARLKRLGARRVAEVRDWVVMEAPTGHRFCVVPGRSEAFMATARVWED